MAATATTPEDHRKLAEYFNRKTDRQKNPMGPRTAAPGIEIAKDFAEHTEGSWPCFPSIMLATRSGAKASRPGLNSLMADAMARKFETILVWKLDRFGRFLVDCLNNIRVLEDHGIRFIAVTQGLDTDQRNPASRFLLHVLGAAAEFERSLIRERTQAGRLRYQQDYKAGKVGKTVYSRSGKNLPIGRPKRIFNRERVMELRQKAASIRAIARQLGVGVGTVSRILLQHAPQW